MNRWTIKIAVIAFAFACATRLAFAEWRYRAILTGTAADPPNASPGGGMGFVCLSEDQTRITVSLSFSNLLAPAVVAHVQMRLIHYVNPPTNAVCYPADGQVFFTLSGCPTATAGAIPEQSFAVTPDQVDFLRRGCLALDVHTSVFPGGEILGELLWTGDSEFIAQPTNQTAAAGASVTHSAVRRYNNCPQPDGAWYFNGTNIGAGSVTHLSGYSGTNIYSLTISNVQPANAGDYYFSGSSDCCGGIITSDVGGWK